jgi:hypothetical protein
MTVTSRDFFRQALGPEYRHIYGYHGLFPPHKTAGALTWPLTSIYTAATVEWIVGIPTHVPSPSLPIYSPSVPLFSIKTSQIYLSLTKVVTCLSAPAIVWTEWLYIYIYMEGNWEKQSGGGTRYSAAKMRKGLIHVTSLRGFSVQPRLKIRCCIPPHQTPLHNLAVN